MVRVTTAMSRGRVRKTANEKVARPRKKQAREGNIAMGSNVATTGSNAQTKGANARRAANPTGAQKPTPGRIGERHSKAMAG